MQSRGSQALPHSAQCQHQRPQAHTGTQEGPSELQETLFHSEYDGALAQLAREVVEAPFPEVSSSCLDSWPWVTLQEQGLDQVTSGGASPQPAVAL